MTKAIVCVSMHDKLPSGTEIEGELLGAYAGNKYWMDVKVPGSTVHRSVIVRLLKEKVEKVEKKGGFVATEKLRYDTKILIGGS